MSRLTGSVTALEWRVLALSEDKSGPVSMGGERLRRSDRAGQSRNALFDGVLARFRATIADRHSHVAFTSLNSQ